MIKVTLTESEVRQALTVGNEREIQSLKDGRRPNYGADKGKSLGLHALGALGELAVAKALNIHWDGGVNTFHAPDAGPFQVRTTTYENGRLVLHPADKDDDLFILVYANNPHFSIKGYLRGCDGKQSQWWTDPTHGNRPAFFVPAEALRPFEEIVDKVCATPKPIS